MEANCDTNGLRVSNAPRQASVPDGDGGNASKFLVRAAMVGFGYAIRRYLEV